MAQRHINQMRFQAGAFDAAARVLQQFIRKGSVPIKETRQPDGAHSGLTHNLNQLGFGLHDRRREADMKRAPGRAAPGVRRQSHCG
jgi:hypothetical protein